MSSRPSRGAARLAAILDALPDALLLVNCNGTVVNANAIALEAFEAPGTALVGRGLLDLLPEFDPNRIPGSMRRPDQETETQERQKPTRMVARRTDGSEFPVEVTSANLEDGRTPYASAFEAAFADHGPGSSNSYTGNELLMLVVRDLTGTLDTETELARQQRQTEMILRAASEGVVGVDTAGRVVLVNPAAAQMLGFRAGDLGGQELHPLVHHSRGDGSPLPYEETPLADSLRSGRKHRVRVGQVLWTREGHAVPVDMTTAPVRDGDQLVGAVMTFTDRRAYESLAARHEQLRSVLTESLRKPLDHMRDELVGLADDPAGQLWPEANQILRHLTAGYSRITTLVDNVLDYQRLDSGRDKLRLEKAALNGVVANGVEGAIELIGPGRAQFALHTPPIEAEVDAERLSTAVAHLVADVAGVDVTGNAPVAAAPGVDSTIVVAVAKRGDVVRIEVRGPHRGGNPVHEPIVRGIVKRHGGVLQTHDVPGAAGGSAYVLEVPVSAHGGAGSGADSGSATAPGSDDTGAGTGSARRPGPGDGTAGRAADGSSDGTAGGTTGVAAVESAEGPDNSGSPQNAAPGQGHERDNETTVMPVPAQPVRGTDGAAPAGAAVGSGSAWTSEGNQQQEGADLQGVPAEAEAQASVPPGAAPAPGQTDGPDGRPVDGASDTPGLPSEGPDGIGTAPETEPAVADAGRPRPTGRRRGRRSPTEDQYGQTPTGEETGARSSALALREATADEPAGTAYGTGTAVPVPPQGTGRRGRRMLAAPAGDPQPQQQADGAGRSGMPELGPGGPAPEQGPEPGAAHAMAPVPSQFPAAAAPQQPRPQQDPQGIGFAQPPAQQLPAQAQQPRGLPEQSADIPDEVNGAESDPATAGTDVTGTELTESAQSPDGAEVAGMPMPLPLPGPPPGPESGGAPLPLPETGPLPQPVPGQQQPAAGNGPDAAPSGTEPGTPEGPEAPAAPGAGEGPVPADPSVVATSPMLSDGGPPREQSALPAPVENEQEQGPRVRTLGQGVPFSQRITEQSAPQQQAPQQENPALPAPPAVPSAATAIPSTPSTPGGSGRRRRLATPPEEPGAQDGMQGGAAEGPAGQAPQDAPPGPMPQPQGQAGGQQQAREFAIGAPAAGAAEGPEPLDGPDSLVQVTDGRGMAVPEGPVDDELPPEPLDNPRRLLVWPEPDVSTQQALSDRGYRPVLVNSRDEVDSQIAAYPAALFVDPLTGPITRKALQSLRTAAVAAEVPVLVTAGLGQATREAAYGADPAVLLKALAPRDSEQHPPRVLLIEEQQAVAAALTASLERRGMQVGHAPTDSEAVNVAAQVRPNLVVMDLMQVRRRRAGIIDWLRVNGLLNRTPFVVYTSAGMDPGQLPLLLSGETVLFLAERSTNDEVQERIVDLLTKIGAN